MEKYLEGEELTVAELQAGVRALTIAGEVNPVLCGTAFKNKGVQPMLDAVIDYLPSPLDVPPIERPPAGRRGGRDHRACTPTTRAVLGAGVQDRVAPVLRQAHLHPGLLRRGVRRGSPVVNSTKGKKERIGKIFQMHSNKENPVDRASAGHIYAVIGLKDTTTGETLCDPANPIVLESMTFPEPVISVAIEPKTKGDQEKLGVRRSRSWREEDPTFQVQQDDETGQTIIKGMGELHLDILVDRMRREFKVEANVGKPQVAYRETIRRTVEKLEYIHKKQTGGSGQYAKVQMTIEPLDTHEGELYEFENKVTGGRIPREYIPSVDQGIQDAMQYGVLAGYPLVGIKATLLDGGLPRRRLLRDGVQDRRLHGAQGRRPQGGPGAPRADDGRRGAHARGVHG